MSQGVTQAVGTGQGRTTGVGLRLQMRETEELYLGAEPRAITEDDFSPLAGDDGVTQDDQLDPIEIDDPEPEDPPLDPPLRRRTPPTLVLWRDADGRTRTYVSGHATRFLDPDQAAHQLYVLEAVAADLAGATLTDSGSLYRTVLDLTSTHSALSKRLERVGAKKEASGFSRLRIAIGTPAGILPWDALKIFAAKGTNVPQPQMVEEYVRTFWSPGRGGPDAAERRDFEARHGGRVSEDTMRKKWNSVIDGALARPELILSARATLFESLPRLKELCSDLDAKGGAEYVAAMFVLGAFDTELLERMDGETQ